MLLKKIVSGGQTGVDQAALRAAKAAGLATGGWMPLGYRTLSGPRPEFAELYGMREHETRDYPPRTSANVRESDGTLRIAVDFESAGERSTMSAIQRHKKPVFNVNVFLKKPVVPHELGPCIVADWAYTPIPEQVADWIVERKIVVLNVAGNSELTAPGIGAVAERFLSEVFTILRVVKS